MTIYTGTGGNDVYVGTSAADIFDMTQGGRDSVSGADNNDTFLFGGTLTKKDIIIGGDGADTVDLDGDYSGGLKLDPSMVFEVETFRFTTGHSYDITFDDTTFVGGATLDGGDLAAGDQLVLDASDETDADLFIIGGAGDDIFKGGQDGNDFDLDLGGADDATGGDGPDHFAMGAAWDALDVLNGKDGTDAVDLGGDYAAGLTILKSMVKNIETINPSGAFDYLLIADANLLGAGETIYVNAVFVGASQSYEFDGSAITNGVLNLAGSSGDDVVTGGDDNDIFTDSQGGGDEMNGGRGDDTFNLWASLDAADDIDGGGGTDTLVLHGDYPTTIVFGSHTVRDIETIVLDGIGSYNFTTDDGNVGAGDTLVVDGSGVSIFHAVTFNGAAELDGNFDITGGDGDDILTGGALDDVLYGGQDSDRLNGFRGDDTLYGGTNADTFNGGLGLDIYAVGTSTNSNGTQYDRTLSFDTDDDVFDIEVTVTGIDTTVNTGALSVATFVNDIQAGVDNAELAAFHAVVFHPDTGDLAGKRFLVIDANGIAGCEAFQDYIIELTNFRHLTGLDLDNFI